MVSWAAVACRAGIFIALFEGLNALNWVRLLMMLLKSWVIEPKDLSDWLIFFAWSGFSGLSDVF